MQRIRAFVVPVSVKRFPCVCQRGPKHAVSTWYPGGPSLNCLPYPFPDPSRPWDDPKCTVCKGFCGGHYTNKMIDISDKSALKTVQMPPSILLKDAVSKHGENSLSETSILEEAKKVQLSAE